VRFRTIVLMRLFVCLSVCDIYINYHKININQRSVIGSEMYNRIDYHKNTRLGNRIYNRTCNRTSLKIFFNNRNRICNR